MMKVFNNMNKDFKKRIRSRINLLFLLQLKIIVLPYDTGSFPLLRDVNRFNLKLKLNLTFFKFNLITNYYLLHFFENLSIFFLQSMKLLNSLGFYNNFLDQFKFKSCALWRNSLLQIPWTSSRLLSEEKAKSNCPPKEKKWKSSQKMLQIMVNEILQWSCSNLQRCFLRVNFGGKFNAWRIILKIRSF